MEIKSKQATVDRHYVGRVDLLCQEWFWEVQIPHGQKRKEPRAPPSPEAQEIPSTDFQIYSHFKFPI